MILVGNQRGGSADLARHLLKEENDHVTLHDLRGFVSSTLPGALNEVYAVSRGTKCRQFLFSLSLNPPPDVQVRTQDFEAAIERIESRLGLADQPRAIVFHEKEGRRHCHAVWSRIDADEMKAVQLSFSKRKLMEVSRELYLEHGWDMPDGLRNPLERDPRNFTLEQWQQAKRIGKDPRQIRTDFQACWQASDSRQAFEAALSERGYNLARGDRRRHVAVDMHGEVFSVAKLVGIKTKVVRARLGNEQELPSVADRNDEFAANITTRLRELQAEEERKQREIVQQHRKERLALVQRQRQERKKLRDRQNSRQIGETKARQARYSKGLRGLWDRFTGHRRKIREQNEAETARALLRDQAERDGQVFEHVSERKLQREQMFEDQRPHLELKNELDRDISKQQSRLSESRNAALERLREERVAERNPSPSRPRGPTLER